MSLCLLSVAIEIWNFQIINSMFAWILFRLLYFFPGLFLIFFLHFMVVLELGFGVGVLFGLLGLGFQLIGFRACGVGSSWVFGVRALYINKKKIKPGEKTLRLDCMILM